jgi:hypothetical protein
MRLIKQRPIIISEPIKENNKEENEIVKQRNFQQNMYIDFLKKFINEKCEYDYQRLCHVNEIKKIYNNFLLDNKDFISKYNVNFSLTPSDIAKLDNRFEFKLLTVCKHCLNKQYRGCCEKYYKPDRTKLSYIVNLKL